MEQHYYQHIRERREAKGLTQKKLAELANIAPGSLSAYENGNKVPPVDVAARIARVLEVSLDWLFGMESDETITQEPKTYADLIRLFLLIAGSYPMVFIDVKNPELQYDYRIQEWKDRLAAPDSASFSKMLEQNGDGWGSSCAQLEIPDKKLVQFFISWKKSYELLKDGTLDDEIYGAWLEKRLFELSKMPLRYSWSSKESSEQPVPQPDAGK